MSKRRIYEVAKELGIESKDLLKKLQDIGADVKSHSSTVDEDDLKRALAGPAPKKPDVRRAPGMVVRKKADIPVSEAHDEGAAVHEDSHPHDVHAREHGEEQHHETRDEGPAARHETPAHELEATPRDQEVTQHAHHASGAPRGAQASSHQEPETRHADDKQHAAVFSGAAYAPPVEKTKENVQTPPQNDKPQQATRAPTALPPLAPPAGGGAPRTPENPGGARVVRMIDRDKLISRIPPRRPTGPGGLRGPGGAGGPGGFRPAGAGGAPGFRPGPGGPGGFRPGGPRPGPGMLEPQMPHPNRFGPVKELRVVTDAFGKGKELRDVNAKKGPGSARTESGPGGPRRERLDKRSLLAMHERSGNMSRLKRRRGLKRQSVSTTAATMKQSKRVVRMDNETMTVSDLAEQLSVKAVEIVRKLTELGTMATMNQAIDFETVSLVAQMYNFSVNDQSFDEEELIDEEDDIEGEALAPRPPVVTVMGHVDHGKTSLLDAIRSENVAEGEAGGITQHIGAYMVDTPKGQITFLDTPGHEAFTSMRARGAEVTDLVILVVAADDGPMPQTVEAIRHAQAAKVPIIVVVNKIDKPGAKPEQIMQSLTEYQLVPEEWGGDTMYVKTSATKRTGIDELLDAVLLQAEVLQLCANPNKRAIAAVVEARLDKGMGPKVSVIVQEGTLRIGDAVVVGTTSGRVRLLLNERGENVEEATPSMPVELVGLDGVPNAGDQLNVVEDLEDAKEVAAHRAQQQREKDQAARQPKVSMDELFAKLKAGPDKVKDLKVIVKADVQGSVEALCQAFRKLSTSEVTLTIVHAAVGAVSEGDVMLASNSGAIVIAFNVKPDSKAKNVAESEGVQIKGYSIIYDALDDVRKAMGGLLPPTFKEQSLGRAEVRQVFNTPKLGVVAGSSVVDGKVSRAARVRVTRDTLQVFDGKIAGLKRFKDDVREVAMGFECGIVLEGFTDVRVGDVIEAYEVITIARTLDSPPPPGGGRTSPGGRSSGGASASA